MQFHRLVYLFNTIVKICDKPLSLLTSNLASFSACEVNLSFAFSSSKASRKMVACIFLNNFSFEDYFKTEFEFFKNWYNFMSFTKFFIFLVARNIIRSFFMHTLSLRKCLDVRLLEKSPVPCVHQWHCPSVLCDPVNLQSFLFHVGVRLLPMSAHWKEKRNSSHTESQKFDFSGIGMHRPNWNLCHFEENIKAETSVKNLKCFHNAYLLPRHSVILSTDHQSFH